MFRSGSNAPPAEGLSWALRVLMDRTGAASVGIAEYDAQGVHSIVDAAHVVGMTDLTGSHRVRDFGGLAASRMRDGHTVLFHDTAHSAELTDADRAADARRVRAELLAVQRMRELEESRDRMARAEEAAQANSWTLDVRTGEFSWPQSGRPTSGAGPAIRCAGCRPAPTSPPTSAASRSSSSA